MMQRSWGGRGEEGRKRKLSCLQGKQSPFFWVRSQAVKNGKGHS